MRFVFFNTFLGTRNRNFIGTTIRVRNRFSLPRHDNLFLSNFKNAARCRSCERWKLCGMQAYLLLHSIADVLLEQWNYVAGYIRSETFNFKTYGMVSILSEGESVHRVYGKHCSWHSFSFYLLQTCFIVFVLFIFILKHPKKSSF